MTALLVGYIAIAFISLGGFLETSKVKEMEDEEARQTTWICAGCALLWPVTLLVAFGMALGED